MKPIFRIIGWYLNILSALTPKLAGKHGTYIFCYPHRIKLNKSQIAFLRKSIYKELHFEGRNIKVYKWGNGQKKVLLLHGWRSNSFRWRRYISRFDLEEYTFYAFDAPGHGLSSGIILNLVIYGKVLNYILKELEGIDSIVAHSMGAFASLYNFYEFENPIINKLVLLGTPGEVSDFIELYKKMLGLNDKVFQVITEYFYDNYGHSFEHFSAAKFATALNMKGLIIHDPEDKEAPIKHAKSIHKNWKESDMIITKGMGHKLNKPEVIDMIKTFITSESEVATH